jgi:hypothetical protein
MRTIPSATYRVLAGLTLAAPWALVGPRAAAAADWQPDRIVLPIQTPAPAKTTELDAPAGAPNVVSGA